MGDMLTQWALVRQRGATAETDEKNGFAWLRSPTGEERAFALADLDPTVRREVLALASGSKVPRLLMNDLLRTGRIAGRDVDARLSASPAPQC